MKYLNVLKFGVLSFTAIYAQICQNNCIQFILGSGTGCVWACNYCGNMLNTSNYYFNPPICQYESGGCVGNPLAGVEYTCCSI